MFGGLSGRRRFGNSCLASACVVSRIQKTRSTERPVLRLPQEEGRASERVRAVEVGREGTS